MEEKQVSDNNGEGSSISVRVKDVTLGRWPFARDPHSATATISMAESTAKKESRALFFGSPTSVILGMKRKSDTLDALEETKLDATSTTSNKRERKYYCSLCKKTATSERALYDHLQGKKHKIKEVSTKFTDPKNIISIDSSSNRAYCSVCEVHIPSEKRVKVHLEGKKHRAKVNMIEKPGGVENGDLGCLSDEEQVSRRPENEVIHTIFESVEKQESKEEIVKGEIMDEKSWHYEICNVTCNDEGGMYDHRKSSEHISILESKSSIVTISASKELAGEEEDC